MLRVPQFEDAFREALQTDRATLPDRSALEAWSSFDLNFKANPMKQMANADTAPMTAQQLELHVAKLEAASGRHVVDIRRDIAAPPDPPKAFAGTV